MTEIRGEDDLSWWINNIPPRDERAAPFPDVDTVEYAWLETLVSWSGDPRPARAVSAASISSNGDGGSHVVVVTTPQGIDGGADTANDSAFATGLAVTRSPVRLDPRSVDQVVTTTTAAAAVFSTLPSLVVGHGRWSVARLPQESPARLPPPPTHSLPATTVEALKMLGVSYHAATPPDQWCGRYGVAAGPGLGEGQHHCGGEPSSFSPSSTLAVDGELHRELHAYSHARHAISSCLSQGGGGPYEAEYSGAGYGGARYDGAGYGGAEYGDRSSGLRHAHLQQQLKSFTQFARGAHALAADAAETEPPSSVSSAASSVALQSRAAIASGSDADNAVRADKTAICVTLRAGRLDDNPEDNTGDTDAVVVEDEGGANEDEVEDGANENDENDDDVPCDVCLHRADTARNPILLCDSDGCSAGARHLLCCTPRLSRVPKGDWHCGRCVVSAGEPVAPADLAAGIEPTTTKRTTADAETGDAERKRAKRETRSNRRFG